MAPGTRMLTTASAVRTLVLARKPLLALTSQGELPVDVGHVLEAPTLGAESEADGFPRPRTAETVSCAVWTEERGKRKLRVFGRRQCRRA